MKKICLGLGLTFLLMLIAAPAFCVPMVEITSRGIFGNDGGIFNVKLIDLPGVNDSFSTWCIETNETLTVGSTYFVEVNTYAVAGGESIGRDYLDSRTAWLYTQYLNGVYTITDGTQAALFQNAIWALEDEIDDPASGANLYFDAADGSGATGIGNIRVLNLWSNYNSSTGVYSGNRQDLLVSVPDASIMLLLGPSLVGLGIIGRRRFKK